MYKIDLIMNKAIALAQKAGSKTLPNPRVGAVVFDDDGKILGKGWHKGFGKAHAEVEAIADAVKHGRKTKNKNLCVTLEPCNHFGKTPPCSNAIIKAGIKKIYIGTTDDCKTVCGAGIQKLKKAGVKVKIGVLKKECRELNPGFHKYNTKGLPFVRLKFAISMNGVMGTAWFTSDASRKRVHEHRANSDLVITGVGTIKKDNPKFNSRLSGKAVPNRIAVLDTKLKLYTKYLRKSLEIFKAKNDVVIITSDDKELKSKINRLKHAKVNVITAKLNKNGRICLKVLIKRLGDEFNYREIMVEAGPAIVKSLVTEAAKLVDVVEIYIAPVILKEGDPLPELPKMRINSAEMLENTLALEGHFDI